MNTKWVDDERNVRYSDDDIVNASLTTSAEAAEALTTLGSSNPADEECPGVVSNNRIITHGEEEDDKEYEIPQRYTTSGRKRAVSFPMKLMKVLSNRKFAHIITWMPSGQSFCILKPKNFAAEILPGHFKSAKYNSFTRKMHRWGFQRHYRGDESGAFYHKDFQRDRFDMVEKMSCPKTHEAMKVVVVAAPVEASSTPSSTNDSRPSKAPSSRADVAKLRPINPVLSMKYKKEEKAAPLAHPMLRPMARPPVPVSSLISACHSITPQPLAPVGTVAMSTPLALQQRIRSEMTIPTAESIAAANLNAAIEMEVSRRLEERIKAAAAQMSRTSAAGLGGMFQPPSSQMALNDNPFALRIKLMQMQQRKEQLQYLVMTGALPGAGQGLGELPKTNIQGAKTA